MTTYEKIIIMSEADQRQRDRLALQLSQETRLPIPRVLLSEWNRLDGRQYKTQTGRAVQLSLDLAEALDALPRTGRFIFSASPFPPIIPDKYLEGAQKWARRKNRKRLRIRFE